MKNGWEIKKLVDICDLQNGYAFQSKSYTEFSNTLNIRMSSIRPSGEFDPEHNIRFLPDSFAQEYSQFLLAEGDLIIAMTDMAGNPKILGLPTLVERLNGRKFLLNQRVGKLHSLSKQVDTFYLRYFLSSPDIKEYYKARGAGGLQINISKKDVLSVTILIPPLSEQKQIVSIVDEAFEALDIAIDNTKQNLTNARELFDSYLNAIFTQKKGDGWFDRKLGDIATLRNGINFTKNSTGESIRIVGVKDFQDNFWMQEDVLEFVKVDGELKEIDTLHKNDILTVRSNGSKELIGRCILVGCISKKTSHSGFTIRIRVERKDIYPPFIVHFLKSKELRKQLTASGGGISISSINQQGLSLIELSFPALEKQKSIVASIDELAIETQRLETIYKQKLNALNELKQSILHKAFTGELTADKADLMTNIEPEAIAV